MKKASRMKLKSNIERFKKHERSVTEVSEASENKMHIYHGTQCPVRIVLPQNFKNLS